MFIGVCGGIVVEHQSLNLEVLCSILTGATILCPCARHINSPEYWFKPKKPWLHPSMIKIVDWNVKAQYKQTKHYDRIIESLNTECQTSLYLSRLVGKPTICIGENKDADQLRGNREADQRLCSRYTDSTLPLLLKSENSSF